jgi:hypothetical protein
MDEHTELSTEPIDQPEPGQPAAAPSKNLTLVLGGLLVLLIGIFLGFIGRGTFGPEAMAARSTATAQAGAVQTRAAANKEVMDLISQQITHWQGNENAPITLIEFSDFQ